MRNLFASKNITFHSLCFVLFLFILLNYEIIFIYCNKTFCYLCLWKHISVFPFKKSLSLYMYVFLVVCVLYWIICPDRSILFCSQRMFHDRGQQFISLLPHTGRPSLTQKLHLSRGRWLLLPQYCLHMNIYNHLYLRSFRI